MKYLKKFEDIENTPDVGDYIIPNVETLNAVINDKINNNIFQIIGTRQRKIGKILYIIKFKLENHIDDNWYLDVSEIKHISKNKEELEILLQSKKYNI